MSKDTVMIDGVEHDLFAVEYVRQLETALGIAQNEAQYYESELDKERARHDHTHCTLITALKLLSLRDKTLLDTVEKDIS